MLEIRDLKKAYREANGNALPILDVPLLDLAAGEQAVIVGQSGSGKTTLLHLIAGIRRADSGSVRLDGADISRLSEAGCDRFRAAKIGYIFQTFNLLPGFTGLENVMLGMTFARGKRDRQRADQLLERVGLRNRQQHKPSAMSVGEQQRVAVARALANRPRLLLADEPTANVDRANQQNVVDLIRQTCREEEISLLLVTHAAEIADQFERVIPLEEVNRVAS